jgi:hypothetical protein
MLRLLRTVGCWGGCALSVLPLAPVAVIFHIVQSSQFKRPRKLGNARESAMLDARERVSHPLGGVVCVGCWRQFETIGGAADAACDL